MWFGQLFEQKEQSLLLDESELEKELAIGFIGALKVIIKIYEFKIKLFIILYNKREFVW